MMLRTTAEREAREAVMRMRMQRLNQPEPVAADAPPAVPAAPECVTPEELARRWHVSPTTIRRWFRDEPGVIQWGRADSRPGKKRAHLSMRIPLAVVERVRRRMARV
jgi:hypothetical protein